MKLGVAIEDTWSFFSEIFEHLSDNYDVTLFRRPETNLPFLNARVNNFRFNRDLEAFLTNNDVVFFEWASNLLAAATQHPKRCGIVSRLHRYELYRWADQINWEAVDKIILVSNAKKEEFGSRFPDQISKIVVIPEAVSLKKFKCVRRPFNGDIGILCHMRPRKRVYQLILAFSEVAQIREDVHLHIGGGLVPGLEEYYTAIQVLVDKLELSDRITFYGNVSEPAMWYRHIDIFISNSYSEGLQVSPIEAIASGCYCLAHNWDGADELLPAEDLYLTDSELISLLNDYTEASEEEKERRRGVQRERVTQKFNIDETVQQIRHVIEDVANLTLV